MGLGPLVFKVFRVHKVLLVQGHRGQPVLLARRALQVHRVTKEIRGILELQEYRGTRALQV